MTHRITAAIATEPLTLSEARLHIKADDTSEDALITAWITAAREMAEHYTGMALAPQTIEMALDEFPPYVRVIPLEKPPVSSITSVKYTDTAGVEQTISSSDYTLSSYGIVNNLVPDYGYSWPSTQDIPYAVRIVYVTGYSTVPKAVKSALQLMVAWFFEHRGNAMDPSDIQPPAAKALLDTVKNWSR